MNDVQTKLDELGTIEQRRFVLLKELREELGAKAQVVICEFNERDDTRYRVTAWHIEFATGVVVPTTVHFVILGLRDQQSCEPIAEETLTDKDVAFESDLEAVLRDRWQTDHVRVHVDHTFFGK